MLLPVAHHWTSVALTVKSEEKVGCEIFQASIVRTALHPVLTPTASVLNILRSLFVHKVFSFFYDNFPYCCVQIIDMKATYMTKSLFCSWFAGRSFSWRGITAVNIQGRHQAQSRVRKQSACLLMFSFPSSSSHSRWLPTFRVGLPATTESFLGSATAAQTHPKMRLLGDCEFSQVDNEDSPSHPLSVKG